VAELEGESAYTLLGRQDLHVHTNMSDGDLSLEEVVAVAAQQGVTVGIADHVSSRNMRQFISTDERLREYLQALRSAPVFRSAEFCWCDPFAAGFAADLLGHFDYIVGSNHGFALPDGTFASPWWRSLPPAWTGRADEVMEIMVHNLCDMVQVMPVQIAAHSTLLPAALLQLEPDLHAWWTEEREDRFIEAAVESGVAIEISNRYRLPHRRLLVKARQAGARFSLGSDGHHLHQVARLEWAVEAARAAGIGDQHLFQPER
jgi:histidinol phosphatase-like PHP family hydrolase